MHHPAETSPLGKISTYADRYDAALLFPIAREVKWHDFGLEGTALPYVGEDIWNCYELSWLSISGKPVVAMMTFRVPADSPCIVESKSLKLYLNSFNQTAFENQRALHDTLVKDLSRVAGAPVAVELQSLSEVQAIGFETLAGECIDDLEIVLAKQYAQPQPDVLRWGDQRVSEVFHSHLLKSNCPVTGQPDWASVEISYQGLALDKASFLQYLISYRQCQDFHEQCAERIFIDLHQRINPEYLRVTARYTRRGGIDINPVRCTHQESFKNPRLVRQ